MSSIVTKTGDDGTTGLLMGGRVQKNDPRIQSIGAIDELNAYLGVCKASIGKTSEIYHNLQWIQVTLVQIMGELAVLEINYSKWDKSDISRNRLQQPTLDALEDQIKLIESSKPDFSGWMTPGSNIQSANLDYATRVCRRAERELVTLVEENPRIRVLISQYINRLSDYLWLLARDLES